MNLFKKSVLVTAIAAFSVVSWAQADTSNAEPRWIGARLKLKNYEETGNPTTLGLTCLRWNNPTEETCEEYQFIFWNGASSHLVGSSLINVELPSQELGTYVDFIQKRLEIRFSRIKYNTFKEFFVHSFWINTKVFTVNVPEGFDSAMAAIDAITSYQIRGRYKISDDEYPLFRDNANIRHAVRIEPLENIRFFGIENVVKFGAPKLYLLLEKFMKYMGYLPSGKKEAMEKVRAIGGFEFIADSGVPYAFQSDQLFYFSDAGLYSGQGFDSEGARTYYNGYGMFLSFIGQYGATFPEKFITAQIINSPLQSGNISLQKVLLKTLGGDTLELPMPVLREGTSSSNFIKLGNNTFQFAIAATGNSCFRLAIEWISGKKGLEMTANYLYCPR